jgi:peptidoglycan-associated lipoprotein
MMKKSISFVFISLLTLVIVFAGCQKKVTKIEPTPELPPVVQPEPTPPPKDDSFKPVEDISGPLKEVLQTIYFEFDRFELSSDAISKLGKVASFMKDHSTVKVLAQGHCDERGSSEYNIGLGDNRARATKNYLTSSGIASDRIETTSYGKERPARPDGGQDESCHAMNRRVEWQVLAK